MNYPLATFFGELPHLELSPHAMELVVQSHRAFSASARDSCDQERTARIINGEIVSDSDSEAKATVGQSVKDKVRAKRISLKRHAKRLATKLVAEGRFLQRKRASKIIGDCPNIGSVIEEYVKDHNVGADAWRRTGILTFDGNANLKYKKIQNHLQKLFNLLYPDINFGVRYLKYGIIS